MPITIPNTQADQTSAVAVASSGNNITLPVPTGAVVGDVLLAVVAQSDATTITTSTPGWERISPLRTTSPTTAREVAVFHAYTAGGIPEAPNFRSVSSSSRIVATMFRVVGASKTSRVLTTGPWNPGPDTANSTSLAIPETGAGDTGLTVAMAYYNANSSQKPVENAQVNGGPVLYHGVSFGPNSGAPATNSCTGLAVHAAINDDGPFTFVWGKALSNSLGLAITIPAEPEAQPEPEPEPEAEVLPESVKVRIYTDGVRQVAGTLAGVQSSQKTRLEVASYGGVPKINTLSSLTSKTPFYIAHRGSGDSWPEHTMTAYSSATAFGVEALELSVACTSDGVLFCHHDTTLLRMTGLTLPPIAQLTWAQVKEIYTDARGWLGEKSPVVKPTLFRDVLNAYANTHVLFIEDKQGTNTTAVLNMLDEYPNDKQRFVWKQWAGAAQINAVTARGYRSWGYFTPDIFARVAELAPKFDMLGVNHPATDGQIANIVAAGNSLGKPVICWEVHTRWTRDRLMALGVKGMMTSNIPYVYSTDTAQRTTDSFATGRRAHGDLPHSTDVGWSIQPKILASSAALRFDSSGTVGYTFGSMGPITESSYTLKLSMRFAGPGTIDSSYHGGLWFGHDRDQAHRASVAGPVGGYHVIQRANGVFELFTHHPDEISGASLGTATAAPPVVGQWMTYQVTVTPENVTVARLDAGTGVITSTNTEYRGGYFGVQKNYASATPALEFSAVSWNSL